MKEIKLSLVLTASEIDENINSKIEVKLNDEPFKIGDFINNTEEKINNAETLGDNGLNLDVINTLNHIVVYSAIKQL